MGRRRWTGPRSIRARMTVRALLIIAPLILLTGAVLAVAIRHEAEDAQSERAAQAARQVALRMEESGYDGPVPPVDGVIRVQVVDAGGEVVASSAALEGLPPMSTAAPAEDDFRSDDTVCTDGSGDARRQCFTVSGVVTDSADQGTVTVYAAVPAPTLASGFLVELGLLVLALTAIAAAGRLIWWSTGRTLRPVERIRGDLERLSAADPAPRLRIPGTGDEIADLARTVNTTLDRLRTALDRQRSFVSDASHELRNPIAGMRTRLEVELSDPAPAPGADRAALNALLGDVERLQRIVGDLLELARIDADVHAAEELIDLSELVATELAFHPLRVPVDTDMEPSTVVCGSRVPLTRLLTNLFANAQRHARSRVAVVVRTEATEYGGRAVLAVHDDGAGIPEDERERVFERFARLAESRRRDPGGSGLGLAISRGVAEAHGGTLTAGASSPLGGASMELRLPVAHSGAGSTSEKKDAQ